MVDINNAAWNESDGLNNSVPPAGFPEGMMPSGVNDASRAVMGAVKRWYDRASPTLISGGSANAQTLTYAVAPTALARGDTFAFVPGFTNTGPATLNVGVGGALAIMANGAPLVGAELTLGIPAVVVYDGGANFNLLGGSGKFLPLTGGSLSGPLVVNGEIRTQGAGAILSFWDRTTNNQWSWYSTGNIARLYYQPAGDRVTFDTGGSMNLAGTTIFFVNAGFGTNGPYYSADATNHIARLGVGNGAFYWQKADGTTALRGSSTPTTST